jgi:hypothetical protein
VFIAGTNAATSITTALTANITGNLSGSVGSVTGAVGSVTGAVGSVTGAVGSVTAGVTVATNNDKTGYGLSSAAVQAIWDALTSALTTVGSIGKLLVDNVNATISSRMASYTQPAGFLAATFPSGTIANTTNITAGTVTTATNVTTVNGLAANVITAASIATDAVDADALAANAVAEIQSGLATSAAVAALNNLSAAQVKTQVVDALNVDTYAEPGQGAPAATTTLAAKLGYLYKSWRNKKDGNGMIEELYADGGVTVDQKATVAESAGVVTKSQVVSGP